MRANTRYPDEGERCYTLTCWCWVLDKEFRTTSYLVCEKYTNDFSDSFAVHSRKSVMQCVEEN